MIAGFFFPLLFFSLKSYFFFKNEKLGFKLAFPTGRDSATFRDTGTRKMSLSRDKGTRDKLKILPRDGTGRDFDRLSRPVPGHPAGQNHFLFCTFMVEMKIRSLEHFFSHSRSEQFRQQNTSSACSYKYNVMHIQ